MGTQAPETAAVAPRIAGPRRSTVAFALAVAATVAGLLVTPTAALAWDAGAESSTSEAALTALTNESRVSAGLPPLRVDPELVALARWRSEDMVVRDYFSHRIPPHGSRVFDRLQAQGYCFEVAGENIGWLSGDDGDAAAAIQGMFLDSETHRDVIMGSAWDVVGVGSYRRADGRRYWTVLFADACPPAGPSLAAVPDESGPGGMQARNAPPPGGLLDAFLGGIARLLFGA
ncbi:MAG TPA: CAP domain-containing protein [Clostridia bacterium]|nr:CAP domain-containing protein [Clostridia bacterium]